VSVLYTFFLNFTTPFSHLYHFFFCLYFSAMHLMKLVNQFFVNSLPEYTLKITFRSSRHNFIYDVWTRNWVHCVKCVFVVQWRCQVLSLHDVEYRRMNAYGAFVELPCEQNFKHWYYEWIPITRGFFSEFPANFIYKYKEIFETFFSADKNVNFSRIFLNIVWRVHT
jgi:hypothetical protein